MHEGRRHHIRLQEGCQQRLPKVADSMIAGMRTATSCLAARRSPTPHPSARRSSTPGSSARRSPTPRRSSTPRPSHEDCGHHARLRKGRQQHFRPIAGQPRYGRMPHSHLHESRGTPLSSTRRSSAALRDGRRHHLRLHESAGSRSACTKVARTMGISPPGGMQPPPGCKSGGKPALGRRPRGGPPRPAASGLRPGSARRSGRPAAPTGRHAAA